MSILTRAQDLFDRIKLFPDGYGAQGPYLKPDALSAFLDLRQLWEREILPLLSDRARNLPPPTQAMIEAGWAVLDEEGIEVPPVEVMQATWLAMERAR